MVDTVDLYFVENLVGVLQCLGHIAKDLVHLLGGLEPFLLAVEHDILVSEFPACRNADEAFMGIGIFLVDKMHIVGTHDLDVKFLGETHQRFVDLHLALIGLMIGTGNGCLVALEFQIIVITKDTLEP